MPKGIGSVWSPTPSGVKTFAPVKQLRHAVPSHLLMFWLFGDVLHSHLYFVLLSQDIIYAGWRAVSSEVHCRTVARRLWCPWCLVAWTWILSSRNQTWNVFELSDPFKAWTLGASASGPFQGKIAWQRHGCLDYKQSMLNQKPTSNLKKSLSECLGQLEWPPEWRTF